MPSCFVIGCSSGYGGSKAHLFKIPSDSVENMWTRNLPKREIIFNSKQHVVCHLHFAEQFLITSNYIIKNGIKENYEERKTWKLTHDAVPTKFSNSVLSTNYNKSIAKRKSPNRIADTTAKLPKLNLKEINFESIKLKLTNLNFPSHDWSVKYEEKFITLFELRQISDCLMVISKSLVINSDLELSAFVRGREIPNFPRITIVVEKDFEDSINNLHNLRVCYGVSGFEDIQIVATGERCANIWYSKQCKITSKTDYCSECVKLRNNLRVRRSRNKKISKVSDSSLQTKLKKSLCNKVLQLQRTQQLKARAVVNLKYISKKFQSLTDIKLEKLISSSSLPDNMKLSMLEAARVAKNKSTRGMRYQKEWLLQCLLLKIKSHQGYRYLRDQKILPLPHPSTLQRLIRGLPCQFGFNDFIFEGLKQEFEKRDKKDRQCILSFDEIKIRESLDFDKANLQMNGFVNFGDFTKDYLQSSKRKKVKSVYADHALVLMVRTLNSKLVQPIAAFASRGAAPGTILAKLVLASVLRLEDVGLEVDGVSCDGATTNKSMWKEFGICGRQDGVINKITHPSSNDDSRHLHFISDVPHILKCIRNNMMKKRFVLFNGTKVCYDYYKFVFNEDQTISTGLRVVPKVTEAHISPSPFQKMRVCLATQLFSNSMATGMQFYRENGCKTLKLSKPTELFTKSMNDLFDALNTSNISNKLKMGDSKYLCIKTFNEVLLDGSLQNSFASDVTMESLRVTLQSVLDLIEYLTSICKYDYILTAKFNQDCLERFFGVLRQIGGDEDHPTANTFLQLYRLLGIYFPTARLLRANVTSSEDVNPSKSYVKNLINIRKRKKDSISNKKQELDSQILKKVLSFDSSDAKIYSSSQPQVSDYIVYNLCGYLVHKCKSFTKCEKCRESLQGDRNSSSNKLSLLTDLKNFGGLKYPSQDLVNFINLFVEPTICRIACNSQNIFNIDDVIFALPNLDCGSLGCSVSEHKDLFLTNIVNYYISIRLYFYCKNRNQQSLRPKGTKNNRKKAKLT